MKITNEQFSDLIEKARKGNSQPLNEFLRELYEKGKYSLLKLAGSETEAEEHFSLAIAKFWEKFVVGSAPLPDTNIAGYIYQMAKFACLDKLRGGAKRAPNTSVESAIAKDSGPAELPKTERDHYDEDLRESRRQQAMRNAIAKLGDNCRRLFQTMLEQGLEKPRELFAILGLKDARAATVLRYECTKQLKVKAAIELEVLVKGEE